MKIYTDSKPELSQVYACTRTHTHTRTRTVWVNCDHALSHTNLNLKSRRWACAQRLHSKNIARTPSAAHTQYTIKCNTYWFWLSELMASHQIASQWAASNTWRKAINVRCALGAMRLFVCLCAFMLAVAPVSLSEIRHIIYHFIENGMHIEPNRFEQPTHSATSTTNNNNNNHNNNDHFRI